ncbi:sugar ABC transporter periplasmic protein [Bifidobacterium mongoliense DSM 21395]|uniref:Sugar ABC transporter periplasmic protein n=1 Tax=Bifidobacterium mongoliense DSM 21395 TaxID=1437603 RepID=A0A087C183_9BIFI|nr:sugar ABC transporter periplasmic protein [Bifidobacterium mongoliense DSM 21395]
MRPVSRSVRRRGGVRAALALLLCVVVAMTSACAPDGKAVGRTAETDTAIDHDSVDRSDILIGVVGSDDASSDRRLMGAFDAAGLNAFYASVVGAGNVERAGADSVGDMVDRAVKAIVVNRMAVGRTGRGPWVDALQRARRAGIPVVLSDPVTPPHDRLLYAAIWKVDDHASHATPIERSVTEVINDLPHQATVTVTTRTARP